MHKHQPAQTSDVAAVMAFFNDTPFTQEEKAKIAQVLLDSPEQVVRDLLKPDLIVRNNYHERRRTHAEALDTMARKIIGKPLPA